MLVGLRAHRHPRARRQGLAAAVLAGEPAAGERAERREAEAVLGAERQHLLLGLAVEQRVRVLHPAEVAGGERGAKLRRRRRCSARTRRACPRARSSSSTPAVSAIGHVRVPGVREEQRHALDAEAAEARLELAADARRREPVVRALVHRVERLRREDDLVAHVGALRAEPLADERLAAAAAVRVGRVERRDARLPGGVHDRERLLARLAAAEERGRAADAAEVAAAEDDA